MCKKLEKKGFLDKLNMLLHVLTIWAYKRRRVCLDLEILVHVNREDILHS